MSDSLSGKSENYNTQYTALQSSLYITVIACVVGGAFFLCNAIFINADKEKAETDIRGTSIVTSHAKLYLLSKLNKLLSQLHFQILRNNHYTIINLF